VGPFGRIHLVDVRADLGRYPRPVIVGRRSRTIALRVVPPAEVGGRPVMSVRRRRRRPPVLECGSCGAIVASGVAPDEIMGLLLRCARCGAVNDAVG
jgi:uncharacterized Zn finger protein